MILYRLDLLDITLTIDLYIDYDLKKIVQKRIIRKRLFKK